jgi:hypothetical protein
LTGVDHDPEVERIWALHEYRPAVFRGIASLGIACATTPNFSMILDVPRSDNLHAMKRIGILYNEMSQAGLPTAIHINGRTSRDFERWGDFLRARPYIGAISYEFITGSGLSGRLETHAEWLNAVRNAVGRPLACVVRGNPNCLELLSLSYTSVYIETTSFVKSIKRQAPLRLGNSRLRWSRNRSDSGKDVSHALQMNVGDMRETLIGRYSALAGDG